MTTRDDLLVWMDLEMTGLEPETCAILEVAMVLTDRELKKVAEPYEAVLWQPEAVLDNMSPFVRNMHEKSGLLTKVRASQVSLADAERSTLELVSRHASYRTARLCGNSVWQDRRFLARYLPTLEGYFHYRQIDVSTLKELATWWHGVTFEKPKEREHRALFDIDLSIAELQFLRTNVFK